MTDITDKRKQELQDILFITIAESANIEKDKISLDAGFTDDMGLDSLDIVELVMALEEKFGVKIPDEESEKIKTPRQALDYIIEHAKHD